MSLARLWKAFKAQEVSWGWPPGRQLPRRTMEPEIPFPSPLPVMPPPTTALSHPGGVFPGREGSLGIQGRPWLCLGNSPHFLTSHTTWRPNLATPHSPGPAPGPLTQPATSPKGSRSPVDIQPRSSHQRDTPKAFPLLGEASQDMGWGEGASRGGLVMPVPHHLQTNKTKWRSRHPQ